MLTRGRFVLLEGGRLSYVVPDEDADSELDEDADSELDED
jgi:hypothetical protein